MNDANHEGDKVQVKVTSRDKLREVLCSAILKYEHADNAQAHYVGSISARNRATEGKTSTLSGRWWQRTRRFEIRTPTRGFIKRLIPEPPN